jgi:peroxiredoxin
MRANLKLGPIARVALLGVAVTGAHRLPGEPSARAAPATAASAEPARGPRAGDKAPRFTLKAVDGSEPKALDRLLKEGAPRAVAVVFLSCKCPYAAQARQPLGELFKTYGSKVTFVGINANQNETLDDIKADAALSFPFPMLRDDGAKVADQYGAERTPEAFLIDASGVIRYHGGVADLGAALGELTGGRAVAKPEAKAFGCTIKRKAS